MSAKDVLDRVKFETWRPRQLVLCSLGRRDPFMGFNVAITQMPGWRSLRYFG
jgi:hypothetical protein